MPYILKLEVDLALAQNAIRNDVDIGGDGLDVCWVWRLLGIEAREGRLTHAGATDNEKVALELGLDGGMRQGGRR